MNWFEEACQYFEFDEFEVHSSKCLWKDISLTCKCINKSSWEGIDPEVVATGLLVKVTSNNLVSGDKNALEKALPRKIPLL